MTQPNPIHIYQTFEDRHWWYVARRRIVVPLVHTLEPPAREATVVDVGCGAGANLAAFVDDYRCVGIDISRDLVEAASRRLPATRFIEGSAPDDLGDVAREADVFLLMDVIEHIEDDVGYFGRLFAAAHPGAAFLLTVPAGPELWSLHDEAVGHQRRYTARSLRRLWSGLAAEEMLLTPFNTFLYPAVRLTRAVNNRRGRTAGGETDFAMPPRFLNAALAGLMGSEAGVLRSQLERRRTKGFPFGVSLLAILRKLA